MEDKFFNTYKRKLEELQGEVDDDIWKNISSAIESDNPLQEKTDSKKPLSFWAFSLILLFLFIGFFLYLTVNKNDHSRSLSQNSTSAIYPNQVSFILDSVSIPHKRTKNNINSGVPTNNKESIISIVKTGINSNAKAIKTSNIITKNGGLKDSSNQHFSNATKYQVAHKFNSKVKTNDQSNKGETSKTFNPDDNTFLKNTNQPITDTSNYFTSTDAVYMTSKTLTKLNEDSLPNMNLEFPPSAYSYKTLLDSSLKSTTKDYKKIGLGISLVGYTPWLLNHTTYNSFDKNKSEILDFSYGSTVSIFACYLLKKHTLQAEMIFNHKNKQSYQTYSSGHTYKKVLLMQYSQVNLICKMQISSIKRNSCLSREINFLPGASYLQLNSSHNSTNNHTENVTKHYSKHNFALIAGVEYQLKIRNFLIATSIRTNIGINNIYTGSATIPKEFNKTYYSGLLLTGSLGYLIK